MSTRLDIDNRYDWNHIYYYTHRYTYIFPSFLCGASVFSHLRGSGGNDEYGEQNVDNGVGLDDEWVFLCHFDFVYACICVYVYILFWLFYMSKIKVHHLLFWIHDAKLKRSNNEFEQRN